MDMSEYVATLRRELATITRFAGDDVTRAAEMLTEAMESSVRLTLLEVLSAAAAEITTRLDDAVIEVRLSGSDADFVVTHDQRRAVPAAAPPAPAAPPGDEAADDMARVTLRLSEPLKAGSRRRRPRPASRSTPGWSARSARRWTPRRAGPVRPVPRPVIGQRYTGFARG